MKEQVRQKAILVVDDEKSIRDIFMYLEGYGLLKSPVKIFTAKDPGEAVRILMKNLEEIALVITDIDMTPFSGWEIIDFARNLRPAPILAVMSKEHSLRSSLEKDNIVFFEKPLSFSEVCGWMDSQLFGPVLN